jgi:hypothetical protein
MTTATIGVWLIAGTPADRPYPCRCVLGRRCGTAKRLCRCAGRTDLVNVPAHCCAHYNTPEVVAAAVADNQWLHWH